MEQAEITPDEGSRLGIPGGAGKGDFWWAVDFNSTEISSEAPRSDRVVLASLSLHFRIIVQPRLADEMSDPSQGQDRCEQSVLERRLARGE